MKERINEIKNIQRHRREVQRIAKEKGYSFPFHDFVKMINIFLFGDKIATKLHRKFSSHHDHFYSDGISYYRDIPNKIEAAIDWESARFTKPEKQLDAFDTWKKYYFEIDMADTLKMLGFWKNK
jgi:hypothetical protein